MKTWIECIKVQAADASEHVIPTIREVLSELRHTSEFRQFAVYCHAAGYGDILVLLCWETEDICDQGSQIGLTLVQTLKHFGLIDHSVWIDALSERAVIRRKNSYEYEQENTSTHDRNYPV